MELVKSEPVIAPPKSYAVMVKMVPHPWHAAIIIFDDGQIYVNRERAFPDRPVTVELEGVSPNEAQLDTLKKAWRVLSGHFNFTIASFDEALLPYAKEVMDTERQCEPSQGSD